MRIVIISVLALLIIVVVIAIPSSKKAADAKIASVDSTLMVNHLTSTSAADNVGMYDSAAVKRLIGKFKVREDEFNHNKWYRPKSAPQYNWTNAFYCYFDGSDGHATNLRFKVQYTDDNWLFIKNCQFLIDGATYATRTITLNQLASIKETIDLYKAMGGTY